MLGSFARNLPSPAFGGQQDSGRAHQQRFCLLTRRRGYRFSTLFFSYFLWVGIAACRMTDERTFAVGSCRIGAYHVWPLDRRNSPEKQAIRAKGGMADLGSS